MKKREPMSCEDDSRKPKINNFLLELNNSAITVIHQALSIQPQCHGHAFNLLNKPFYN